MLHSVFRYRQSVHIACGTWNALVLLNINPAELTAGSRKTLQGYYTVQWIVARPGLTPTGDANLLGNDEFCTFLISE